jgi:uncharacterized protein
MGMSYKQVDNAKTKADIAASATGLKVIGVKSIIVGEAGSPPPVPVYSAKAFDGAAASPTPIISGQQEITATVSIIYLLGYIISSHFFEDNIRDKNKK